MCAAPRDVNEQTDQRMADDEQQRPVPEEEAEETGECKYSTAQTPSGADAQPGLHDGLDRHAESQWD